MLTVVVLGANALPALILSPIVGKVATGHDPRTVEIIGNFAKIAISLALAVVATAGSLTYPVLVIANVLNGIVSAMVAPVWRGDRRCGGGWRRRGRDWRGDRVRAQRRELRAAHDRHQAGPG